MKLFAVRSFLSTFSILAVLGGSVIAINCNSGGGGGDDEDKASGGAGGEGGGGEEGGAGGEEPSKGGKGGSSAKGGSGGSDEPAGGEGGGDEPAGGTGGSSPMTGGTGGTGNSNTGGMTPPGGKPAFCTDPKVYPGSEPGTKTTADIAAGTGSSTATAGVGMDITGTAFSAGWVPSEYETAAADSVGLFVAFGSYTAAIVKGAVRKGLGSKELPPIIVAQGTAASNNPGGFEGVYQNYKAIYDELKAKYPKLSAKPEMHGIAGQSTAGAVVWAAAYRHQDMIGLVVTGSGSFVCFMSADYPHANKINGSASLKMRLSMVVGNCDIYGTLAKRIEAGCSTDANEGTVDASQCQATWIDANKAVQTAMEAKKFASQLLVVGTTQQPKGHVLGTWAGNLLDQLRFLYRPAVCGN